MKNGTKARLLCSLPLKRKKGGPAACLSAGKRRGKRLWKLALSELLEPGGKRARRMLIVYPRALPVAIFLLVIAITALSVFAIERGASPREQTL
ncbi:MAG: hypothetical protein ACR2FJ_05420, partial [Qipengyuania sp.]